MRLALVFSILFLATSLGRGAGDERIVERYKELLRRNPAPGTALDRLWEAESAAGHAERLIREFAGAEDFSSALIEGHLLVKKGDSAGARVAFQKATVLDASDPRPWTAIAQVETSQGNHGAAAHALEDAAKRSAGRDLVDAQIALGKAWLAAGEEQKAAEIWMKVLAARPDDLGLRRELAGAYESRRNFAGAAEQYEAIAARGEAYGRITALRDLARVRREAGDNDAAIEALNRALPLAMPGNWMRQELEGEIIRLHRRLGRIPELEGKWREDLETNPRDAGAYLKLVALYEDTAQFEHERDVWQQLVARAPENAAYKRRLAEVHLHLNERDAAAAIFDELLAADPENADFLLARAEIDVQIGATIAAAARIDKVAKARPDAAVEFLRRHRLWPALEKHLSRAVKADPSPESITALADFLFSRDRGDEAARVLYGLVDPGMPNLEKAAAWARIGGILRERGRRGDAEAAFRAAVELTPKNLELRVQLGDVQAQLGRRDEAAANYKLAKADDKLFRLLGEVPSAETVLDAFTEELKADVKAAPTPENLQRLARWHLLRQKYADAAAVIGRALRTSPEDIRSRELAVTLAQATGNRGEAVEQLRELARLDPANALKYQRESISTQLNHGDAEEALDELRMLAEKNPRDAQLTIEYALALQRADRWFEALEAWRRAYAGSDAAARRSIVQPELRVMERLGLHDQALEFLNTALAEEQDDTARENLFRDFFQYAQAHDRMEWLLEKLRDRLRAAPEDRFAQSALVRVMEELGMGAEAFEIANESALSAKDPAEALENVVRQAAELGRMDEAIEAQRRLVWSRPAPRAADFSKLADLQETALEIDAARRTWKDAVSRFGRETEVLRDAAEFFERWYYLDSAREALRAVRAVDAEDLQSLTRLAQLSAAAGDTEEALSAYEQLLQETASPPADTPTEFPTQRAVSVGVQRALYRVVRSRGGQPNVETLRQMREFWQPPEKTIRKDADYRLEAIRAVSEIRTANGSSAGWLREWDRRVSQSPGEALWAFYFAGDGERTMRLLDAMRTQRPGDANVLQGFLWLGLQLGQFEAIATWLTSEPRTPVDRDLFAVVLGQYLAMSPREEVASMSRALFGNPAISRQVLWQAAAQLAQQNFFEEAARNGDRVFAETVVQRASFGTAAGTWHLKAGSVEEARRIWLEAARSRADGLEGGRHEALRRYSVSLPLAERAHFENEFKVEDSPIDDAIATALLAGLAEDAGRARRALSRLIDMRAIVQTPETGETPSQRYWRFMLTLGSYLQAWELNDLAVFLWEEVLADEAGIRLQGPPVQDYVREMKLRLVSAQLVEDTPVEARHRVANFVRTAGPDSAMVMASILEGSGLFRLSVVMLEELTRRDPLNLQYLRLLLNACRGADDQVTAERVMYAALEAGAGEPALWRSLSIQCLDFLMARGDFDGALALVDKLGLPTESEPMLLERRAAILAAQGKPAEAEDIYRMLVEIDPKNGAWLWTLAGTLQRQNKLEEAISLVRSASRLASAFDSEERLVTLYLTKGDLAQARSVALRIVRPASTANVPAIARKFAEKGDTRFAQVLLYNALRLGGEAQRQRDLQATALELAGAKQDPEIFSKGMVRLKALSRGDSSAMRRFYELREKLAMDPTEVRQELESDWDEGEVVAGAQLAGMVLAEGDEAAARRITMRLLENPGTDFATLTALLPPLQNAGLGELATRVLDRLIELQPTEDRPRVQRALLLLADGHRDSALAELEILAARRVLDRSAIPEVASAFEEAGEPERAGELFRDTVERDPAARNVEVFNSYVRFLIRHGDLRAARRILLRGFSNPRNEQLDVVIEYLAADGNLAAPDNLITDMALSESAASRLRKLIDARER